MTKKEARRGRKGSIYEGWAIGNGWLSMAVLMRSLPGSGTGTDT